MNNELNFKMHIRELVKEASVGDEPLPAEDERTGDPLYTLETVITLVNTIRSGKSLKDKKVISDLTEWWDTHKTENLQRFIFTLAKLAKIITAQETEEGDDLEVSVEEPAEPEVVELPEIPEV